MIPHELAFWLGLGAAALAVFLAAVRMAFADLSPGALRKLELASPRRAPLLRRWMDGRDEYRVSIRALHVAVCVLAGFCLAAWLHHHAGQGGGVGSRPLAVCGLALGYFLLTELLGCGLGWVWQRHLLRVWFPLVRALTLLALPLAIPLARWHRFVASRLAERSDEEELPTTEDEILSLVEQDEDAPAPAAALDADERRMIRGVLDLDETPVREIMTPRVDIVAVADSATVAEVRAVIAETEHSRIPVYRGSIDHIVGILHAKDLLRALPGGDGPQAPADMLRPTVFIPEAKNVGDLLAEFQQSLTHVAVVVDEYGGTAGIVTIEDILEVIVGEIHDEYDGDEKNSPPTRQVAENETIADARTLICDLNEAMGLAIAEDQGYETLGGFVVYTLGRIPHAGETLVSPGFDVQILEADDRHVVLAKVIKKLPTGAEAARVEPPLD
ncbi:MAG: Magnesium and cobalt efflux protein CorC [Lentisphaerae bacterium ADurb.BinA184]|nr:MAG: Magnesium and cobalt efflux protein CorC [Lentisphaerae bacterium ADurb.BinA184]